MANSKPSIYSTEPQARKVMQQIESTRAAGSKPERDTGGKTTAKMPAGVMKTPTQAAAEKAKIQAKIDARIKRKQLAKSMGTGGNTSRRY